MAKEVMDSNTVAFAAITLTGAICTGFFALVNKLNKSISKLADGKDKEASATLQVAKETKKAAQEANDRNGHLAELVISTARQTQDLINKPVHVQTVETQVVKEQK